jgi:hypothetical protein
MGDFRGAIERDADKLIMALLIGAAIVGLVSGFQENGLGGGILGAGVGPSSASSLSSRSESESRTCGRSKDWSNGEYPFL